MTEPSTPNETRRSRAPVWLAEGVDIVEQRRVVLLGVTGLVVAVGIALTLLVPNVVPPVPIVGTAVAVAAMLLGLAAAVAVDTTDLTVRGPRHVGAAGGELVAVLPTRANADAAAELAAAVSEARDPGKPLLLGLAAAGRDVRPTADWTDALGRALVRGGAAVLLIDLATGRSRAPGLVEVVRDGVKLTEAVRFEPGLRFARLGAGDDHGGALESLATLPARLPKDLDVLLVALPTAASRPVVTAVRSLDHVLIVAQRDRTSRVDLIAGLDALEAAGTHAQVALLDDRTARRLGLVPQPDDVISSATAPAVRVTRPDVPAFVAGEPGETAEGSDSHDDGDDAAADEVDPDEVDRDAGDDEVDVIEIPVDEAAVDEAAPRIAEDPGLVGPDEPEPDQPEPRGASRWDEPTNAVASPGAASGTGAAGVLGIGAAALGAAEVATGLHEAPPDQPEEPPDEPESEHDDHAALEPRDVDVMLGAREAAAAALVEAPAADIPTAPPSQEPSAGESEPDAATDGAPEVTDADDEDTDELPSVPRPQPVSGSVSDHEDLLRTTAQLAHLMDDLDVRPDESHDDPAR